MGINPTNLTMFLEWEGKGLLKRGNAVLDLGAQEIFCTSNPAEINRFVTHFGGEPFSDAEVARLADRGLAGELFGRIGSPYTSIDLKPYPFGIVMDLNHDALPSEHHGRYQLVTNHGTSEHIINQWNVLKTMHDAAAVGAALFHNVPFCGDFEHGLINYNPKFWWLLSMANGYRIVSMRAAVEEQLTQIPAGFSRDIEFVPMLPSANNAWLQVLFQKVDDRPFAGIVDTPVIG
jgi:hypothetical protein